jgi:hypothetical protein
MDQTQPVTEVSLVGFSDSPEYQAYVEWETWYRSWEEENPNWFSDHGVDDSWHETSDNYWLYYRVFTQEQADQLDEIVAKYGLTLHTGWQWGRTLTQLQAALDVEPILGDGLSLTEFHLYEDGSFSVDGSTDITGDSSTLSLVVSVNGSFTDIGWSLEDDYQEWAYTTASGREVLLAATEDYSWAVAKLDGCFVYARFNGITDQALAQALVEKLDLEGLNARFATASARQQAAQAVADWVSQRQSAVTTDNVDEEGTLALEILGNYVITDLPEGSYLWQTRGVLQERVQADNEYFGASFDPYYQVCNAYETDCGEILLYYRTLLEGETTLNQDTLEIAGMGYTVTQDTINGYPALVVPLSGAADESHYQLLWLDTDRDLVFSLLCSGDATLEQMKAWAQSVTAADPDLETGSAVYQQRAAERQEQIEAIVKDTLAGYEANSAAAAAELERRLSLMGDLSITAQLPAGITYAGTDGSTPEQNIWDPNTEAIMGTSISIDKWYDYPNSATGIYLKYQLCRNDQGQSVAQEYFEKIYNACVEEMQGGYCQVLDCQVGSYDAFATVSTAYDADNELRNDYQLVWLDTDRDLVFTLSGFYQYTWDVDDQLTELITLAESVQ